MIFLCGQILLTQASELENIIEHAFVLFMGSQIDEEHLPKEIYEDLSPQSSEAEIKLLESPLAQAEAAKIIEILRRHAGNRRKTAAELGINKTTLWRKIKKYGITLQ